MAAKPLADRFGKKGVFTLGPLGATAVQLSFFVVGPTAIGAMFLLTALSSVCYGPTLPLLWAMMADVADYSEWKTGRRATGVVFAGLVFALKAGLGVGGVVAGWLLANCGYTADTARSPEVLTGIRSMASLYSAIPFALGVGCILFYPISEALSLQLSEELDRRRQAPAAL